MASFMSTSPSIKGGVQHIQINVRVVKNHSQTQIPPPYNQTTLQDLVSWYPIPAAVTATTFKSLSGI